MLDPLLSARHDGSDTLPPANAGDDERRTERLESRVVRIDVIEDLNTLAGIRKNWEAVYAADPEAQFYLSWTWLSKWLEKLKDQWFVLAVKPPAGGADYVAFLPLRVKAVVRKEGGFDSQIVMAGNNIADYTGFLCRPEFSPSAIPAFAEYLKRLRWASLNFDCIHASGTRMALFLRRFAAEDFSIKKFEQVSPRDNLNLSVCPQVTLPSTWEAYLGDCLSANTRQKVRRFLRKVEGSPEFRITQPDAGTIERDIDILLDFWAAKWGARKGNNLPSIRNVSRAMLLHCFQQSALFFPVLWQGDVPRAMLASFVDPVKASLLFFMAGRDESFNSPPPGFVLHAYSIRYAIAHGFRTYDFLRGNEPYKYLFGPEDRRIRHVTVQAVNGRASAGTLDRRSIAAVLQHASQQRQAGCLDEAEICYRQVLDVEPRSASALYGLGLLVAEKRDYEAAEGSFRALVEVAPGSSAGWFRLGEALEAQRRVADAADAYQAAVDRHPDFAPARDKLARALSRLGPARADAAAATLSAAAGNS